MGVIEKVSIVHTPGILGGKARIEGHRVSVQLIGIRYDLGHSVDQLLTEFPTLNRAEIETALQYYRDNRDEIAEEIQREDEISASITDVVEISEGQLSDPNYKLVLTPADIAAEFGVTVDAVYQAVRRGSIRHRRSGATILIARWDAEKRWKVKSKRGRPRKKRGEVE